MQNKAVDPQSQSQKQASVNGTTFEHTQRVCLSM